MTPIMPGRGRRVRNAAREPAPSLAQSQRKREEPDHRHAEGEPVSAHRQLLALVDETLMNMAGPGGDALDDCCSTAGVPSTWKAR